MKTLRLAVLISGRGSNLQALIDACRKPGFPAEIAVVVSNTPDAGGLAFAADAGIPAMICDHTYFKGDKAAFENALIAIIDQHKADLVCLAGFMRVLGPTFLSHFRDSVINIHPSLLPAHKGLDTHASVLRAGDKTHGASVHVVTAGVDEGMVIAQRQVKVKKNDTADTLAARVLAEEHILYADVVKKIALKQLIIRDGLIETPASIRHHEANKESEVPMAHEAHSAPVADAEEIQRSRAVWSAFTKATTIAGGAVAVTLILMAIFLV